MKYIAVLIACLMAGQAQARVMIMDGETLHEYSEAYGAYQQAIRSESNLEAELLAQAMMFMSYVDGVRDNGMILKVLCFYDSHSNNQIRAVVMQYLESHPEKWKEPAILLVTEVLSEKFACPEI